MENIDALIEIEENKLADLKTDIEPEIQLAIENYFTDSAGYNDTLYANFMIQNEDINAAAEVKEQELMLIDIRSAADFAEEHLRGAVNIPLCQDWRSAIPELPKDKKLIIYCYTGQTSGQLVAALRLLGYDAISLRSGFEPL